MNNFTITLTGVDEQTDVSEASKLDCEIGILYTTNPEGRNRYPSLHWISANIGFFPRVALHVCGSKARGQLYAGELDSVLSKAQRIQINGEVNIHGLEKICCAYPRLSVITQHNNRNLRLAECASPNHQILVDASGGRGISPEKWIRPETEKIVGFAGGLGPDNLFQQMEILRGLAAGDPSWVDMEGKLRLDDWFSIELARKAISEFHRSTSFSTTGPKEGLL